MRKTPDKCDNQKSHPFSEFNKPGIDFVRSLFLRSPFIKALVESAKKSGRQLRVLDIGSGNCPYLKEPNSDSPIPFLKNSELILVDPKGPQCPNDWSFAKAYTFCFDVKDGFLCGDEPCGFKVKSKKVMKVKWPNPGKLIGRRFDLIILSATAHELFLDWCGRRIEENQNTDSLDFGEDVFYKKLFDSLGQLLNDGGLLLFVENYCPKRVGKDSQMLARRVQYKLLGHADTPAIFVPTENYYRIAAQCGFERMMQNSERCIDVKSIQDQVLNVLKDDAIKALDAFEGRRFGVMLLRFSRQRLTRYDAVQGKIPNLHRGFVEDLSSSADVKSFMDALREWKSGRLEWDVVKKRYAKTLWGEGADSNETNCVFQWLVTKCYDVVDHYFRYEVISDLNLFACWVSIHSVILGSRFAPIDGEKRMQPLLYDKGHGCRKAHEGSDWNGIAFNSFSSIKAFKYILEPITRDGVSAARCPSVYNYMRSKAKTNLRSLTLTYARLDLRFQDEDGLKSLLYQEDVVNARDLIVRSNHESDDDHVLIPFDFDEAHKMHQSEEDCAYYVNQVKRLKGKDGPLKDYFRDVQVNDKGVEVTDGGVECSYVACLTAMYLDFLFLRRKEQCCSCVEGRIATWLHEFESRWIKYVRNEENFLIKHRAHKKIIPIAHKKIISRLEEAVKSATQTALKSAFVLGKLPRSFVTFSAPQYWSEDGTAPGSIMIFSDRILPRDVLCSMIAVTEKTFDIIRSIELDAREGRRIQELMLANTQSAISSIMSRNGSHNIGSHVLAALSHNIGTMPDDRVLYQYIQHRMDYIATVTTESPSWAASTKFIGEMMRTFLSQRHLLEYIASSEGLHAYRFQDPNIDIAKQAHTIQIHVRYGKHAGGKISFDDLFFNVKNKTTDRKQEKSQNEVKDVSLAIPGGVVGQHAFFTIIENVIRNAAKHGWSSKTEQERDGKNLEIYIDAVDDADKDYVTFRIWDNMSEVKLGKDGGANVNAINNEIFPKVKVDDAAGGTGAKPLADLTLPLTSSQTKKLVERFIEESCSDFDEKKRLLDGDKIPLHWRQQILMDQKIIKEDGSLRRENWGMAEMKISAGYLQRRTVGQIGGLDELEDPEDYIVRAITVPDAGFHRLGYEFKVPRPKKAVIVVDGTPGNGNEDNLKMPPAKVQKELKRDGICFLSREEALRHLEKWDNGEKTDAFAAEYLVIENAAQLLEVVARRRVKEDNKKCDKWKQLANVPFPFRVLVCDVNRPKQLQGMLPQIAIKELLDDYGVWKDAQGILKVITKKWTDSCLGRKNLSKVNLSIQAEKGGGSGQALISNCDIWRLLFTEYFHSTLSSFDVLGCKDDLKAFCASLLLDENRSMYEFVGDSNDKRFWKYDDETGDLNEEKVRERRDAVCNLKDRASMVAWQFKKLLADIPSACDNSAISDELDAIIGGQTKDLLKQLKAIRNRYQHDSRSDIDRLIKHFVCAFDQLDVMLRKYEERIATLPDAYSPQQGGSGGDAGPRNINISASESKDSRALRGSVEVNYDRHHDVIDSDFDDCALRYIEPLSGSQSYLNALMSFVADVNAADSDKESSGEKKVSKVDEMFKTRLVENGLMRVLLVDERVSRFLRNHEKSRLIYRAMNMWCVDETDSKTPHVKLKDAKSAKGQLLALTKAKKGDKFKSLFEGLRQAKNFFDVLIIHQGILDKWSSKASSVEGMEKLIEDLKSVVDYVVITTGRGTPANIPTCARILPFSSIESTLFKLYPEKLTLIDSIMNTLPLGGARK